ncbi:MAG TPA: hypothetical protein VGM75_33865 [Pseudonocardiaceae bacterium]
MGSSGTSRGSAATGFCACGNSWYRSTESGFLIAVTGTEPLANPTKKGEPHVEDRCQGRCEVGCQVRCQVRREVRREDRCEVGCQDRCEVGCQDRVIVRGDMVLPQAHHVAAVVRAGSQ